MEEIIAEALDCAGITYSTPAQRCDPTGLDFRLANGVEIEVKRMHSPRIAEQMARAENVIALQGEDAVNFFADLLRRHGAELAALAGEEPCPLCDDSGFAEYASGGIWTGENITVRQEFCSCACGEDARRQYGGDTR